MTTYRNASVACFRRVFVAGLLASAVLAPAGTALARSPARTYSPNLGGRFYIGRFDFPGYGRQWAVCVIELDNDSSLHAAGVRPGDIITRLDNIRVTSLGRLEQHYCWTTIRYFRGHDGNPYDRRKTCYNRRFHIRSRHCNCR